MKSATLALCLSLPIAVQAQPSGSRPPQIAYDSSREITLQGTVSSVSTRPQGPGKMVSITLQTQSKGMEIMVGPDFILQAKNFSLTSGDEITIICAPTGRGYMARQITRGSDTLTLLDESGKPTGGAAPQGMPPQ